MAEIKVSTEGMKGVVTEFNRKISDWNNMVDNIWSLLRELDSMWDGDANEAFNALIAEDKPKFTSLSSMMETYKNAITTAAEKYENGEKEIKDIVTARA